MATLFPLETAAAQDPDAAPTAPVLREMGPAESAALGERACEKTSVTALSGGTAGPAPDGGAWVPEKLSMAAMVPALGGFDRKLQKVPGAVVAPGDTSPKLEKLPLTGAAAAVPAFCGVALKPGAAVAPGGAFRKLEKLPEAAEELAGWSNENSKPAGPSWLTPAAASAPGDLAWQLQKGPAAAAVLTDRIQEKVIAVEVGQAVRSAVPVPDGGDRKPQKVPAAAGGVAISAAAEAKLGEESEPLSTETSVQWMEMCICPLTMVRV